MTFRPILRNSPAILLLSKHDAGHNTFITHLDKSPISAKVYAFIPPLCLNIFLLTILIWRLTSGTSHYLFMFAVFDEVVWRPNIPLTSWFRTIINIVIDSFLWQNVWPIVREFVTGHLWLRIRWGFRETEIVFRKPTGSRRPLLNSLSPEEFQREYFNALYRAINPTFLAQNTGYNTHSDFWVVDYKAPCEAYALAASGDIDEKTWDLSVWHMEDGVWEVWEVWRVHDKESNAKSLDMFKAKLDAIGKLDLFEQWQIMITQAVVDGPRHATFETQQATLEFFQREGVNFSQIWADIYKELHDAAALSALVA